MKFLIIRFSSLGDIVLCEPVSFIIHSNFPEAEIDFLTKKEFFPIVKSFRKIDNVYSVKSAEIYKKRYDIIIDLHSKLSSYYYSTIIKSKRVIHYKKKHLQRVLITKKLFKFRIKSVLDLYLQPLQKLGFHIEKVYPILLPEFDENIENFFKTVKNDKKIIAIFPGAKHKTKIYPPEYFKQFIMANQNSYNFILLGSLTEKILSYKIANGLKNVYNFTGKLNLSELVYFISKVDIVISNDSGPMHIAAALSKPQIAIFGSTHPFLGFAPLNKKAVIIQKKLPCRPCHIHGSEKCPLHHFRCMKDISSYELTTALKNSEKVWKNSM